MLTWSTPALKRHFISSSISQLDCWYSEFRILNSDLGGTSCTPIIQEHHFDFLLRQHIILPRYEKSPVKLDRIKDYEMLACVIITSGLRTRLYSLKCFRHFTSCGDVLFLWRDIVLFRSSQRCDTENIEELIWTFPSVITLYMGGYVSASSCVLMHNESGMLLVCCITGMRLRSYLSAGNHEIKNICV